MIIDTHCHFDMLPNPNAYIRQKEACGEMVIGMTNLPSHFMMGSSHVKSFRNIRLALGFHPLLVDANKDEISLFKTQIDQTSYIGEIGLDFSAQGIASKDSQMHILKDILNILKDKKKILSVHSRKAEKELLDLLIEYDIKNVIFHWYSGPIDLIPSIVARGYYFSVNEAMLLTKNGQKILKNIPKDRILTETDSPFNSHTNIKKILTTLQLQEEDIYRNFMTMIAKLR